MGKKRRRSRPVSTSLATPVSATAEPARAAASCPETLWQKVGISALIVIGTIAVYFRTFHSGYIWDDHLFLTDNASLKSLQGLRHIWFDPKSQVQYYPVAMTSLWIEYHLWGLAPAGYHVVNVLLHAINAVLVWRVMVRLGIRGAVFAGLLFAVHPVQVESVAWIAERKNVMAGTFYFLAMLAWLRFAESKSWIIYGLFVLCFVAGTLSKLAVATLVPIFIIWIWWKHAHAWRQYVSYLVPLFIFAIILGLVAVWHERLLVGSEEGFGRGLTPFHRVIIAGRALWFYVWKLVLPVNLMAIYPKWKIEPNSIVQWLWPLSVVIVVATLWYFRCRIGKGPLVATLVFILGHSMTLSFVDFGFLGHSYVADRFQYFPCVAMFALVSAGLMGLSKAGRIAHWASVAAGAVVAVVLAALSFGQTYMYKDLETFWNVNLARNPSYTAYSALGEIYFQKGDLQKAKEYQSESLSMANTARAHFRLGMVLSKLNEDEQALEEFFKALEIARRENITVGGMVGRLLYNIGVMYWEKRDWDAAANYWRQALTANPKMAEVPEWLQKAETRSRMLKSSGVSTTATETK